MLIPEERAVLDFLRGDYSRGRREASSPAGSAGVPAAGYLPAAAVSFAVVTYEFGVSVPVVRRVTGMFDDALAAESYAMRQNWTLYDVVPATTVIAQGTPAP